MSGITDSSKFNSSSSYFVPTSGPIGPGNLTVDNLTVTANQTTAGTNTTTGALSAGSVASGGAVTAVGAISGASLTASGALTAGSGNIGILTAGFVATSPLFRSQDVQISGLGGVPVATGLSIGVGTYIISCQINNNTETPGIPIPVPSSLTILLVVAKGTGGAGTYVAYAYTLSASSLSPGTLSIVGASNPASSTPGTFVVLSGVGNITSLNLAFQTGFLAGTTTTDITSIRVA